jgi:hypothetical protein
MAGRRLDPMVGDEFDKLFERIERTAFRLETLQRYAVPYEDELVRRFLAGEARPAEFDEKYQWWRSLLRDASASGKRVQRVHVVAEPLCDYMRFELTWAYAGNTHAGEDIGIIPVRSGEWPTDLPGHGYDFWLFDASLLAVLQYDHEGRLFAVDLVDDPARILEANAWRDAALRRAIPYEEYIDRHKDLTMRLAS